MDIASVYDEFSDRTHRIFRRAMAHGSTSGEVRTTDLLRAFLEEEYALCQQAIPALRQATGSEAVATLPSHWTSPPPTARAPLSNSPALRSVLSRSLDIARAQTQPHPLDPACLLIALLAHPAAELAGWSRQWRAEAIVAARETTHRLNARTRAAPAFEEASMNDIHTRDLFAKLAGASDRPQVSARERERCSTPTLDAVGRDLTRLAGEGSLDEPIGREDIQRALTRALLCRDRGNVFLLGPAGAGKTAVVHGLAVAVARGRVPRKLRGLRIVEVSCMTLAARSHRLGDLEELLEKITDEAESARVVLFIDEIHLLIGVGRTGGSDPLSAGQLLKPALSEGRIRLIGATTQEEFDRFIAMDRALVRRFQTIAVPTASPEEAWEILSMVRPRYEAHHGVSVAAGLVARIVDLARDHLAARCLPDSAVQLLDAACAAASLAGHGELTEEDLLQTASDLAGVPVSRLAASEQIAALTLKGFLRERLLGQDAAVQKVCEALAQSFLGLRLRPARPLGAFLCVGPTGVGKSHLAELVAEHLKGDSGRLARLDMAELTNEAAVWALMGSAPGYVGHGEVPGKLARIIREDPSAVILLDELEKAHPTVWSLLLGILDTGRATDNRGHLLDFHRAIIVMTANLSEGSEAAGAGFAATSGAGSVALPRVDEVFPPELLARVTVVPFRALGKEALAAIARRKVAVLLAAWRGGTDRKEAPRDFEADIDRIATRCAESGRGARCVEAEVEGLVRRRVLGQMGGVDFEGCVSA